MPEKDPAVLTMEANIAEKTGKTVSQWVAIVRKTRLEKHGQIVKFLKSEHGFTHGYAQLVTFRALESSAADQPDADLVEAQYAGPKAGLKPIYDRILAAVKEFGPGLEVAPKKTYVSLRHKTQFALVQPSTKTRVDLGIKLKGKPPTARLEDSGSFNSMVTHRVRLETPGEVDKEVIDWLKAAFDASG
ncbi:MAG: DUF5655 domain-containing protein [Lysobacterales bacterium]|jgi:hypothetical protein